jgi:hypothetical protein
MKNLRNRNSKKGLDCTPRNRRRDFRKFGKHILAAAKKMQERRPYFKGAIFVKIYPKCMCF